VTGSASSGLLPSMYHVPCHPQVENVDVVPPHSIKFDFLGKDSIRCVHVSWMEG
jgi:hypothetical protein